MKRTIVVLVVVVASLTAAASAGAYSLLTSTDNVSLSIEWSQTIFPTSPFGSESAEGAVIVRQDAFADSLAAGALGARTSSPVLMNPRDGGLDATLEAELERIDPTKVWIIGGTAAVSTATADDLAALGYTVQRLAGADRTATSAAVFLDATTVDGFRVFESGATPRFPAPELYITRAFAPAGAPDGPTAFADALGAGMLAGSTFAPLLTTQTATLSPATRSALESAREELYGKAIIIGGTAAISTAIEGELEDLGFEVERIAGATRYETAALLAEESFGDADDGFDTPGLIAIVDGAHSNSWASGFPASAFRSGAVILSNGEDLPEASDRFLLSVESGNVVCAPEVPEAVCAEAETLVDR